MSDNKLLINSDNFSDVQSADNSELSDYVLDSENSESPCSDKNVESNNNLQFIEISNNTTMFNDNIDKIFQNNILKKTCSTGDLRLYHKTELKKKINHLEMKFNELERKFENLAKQETYLETKQETNLKTKQEIVSNNNNFYQAIKWCGLSILLYHVVKYI